MVGALNHSQEYVPAMMHPTSVQAVSSLTDPNTTLSVDNVGLTAFYGKGRDGFGSVRLNDYTKIMSWLWVISGWPMTTRTLFAALPYGLRLSSLYICQPGRDEQPIG